MTKNRVIAILGLATVSLLSMCLYQRHEIQRLNAKQKAHEEKTAAKFAEMEARQATVAEKKHAAMASAKMNADEAKAVPTEMKPQVAAAVPKAESAPDKEAPMAGLAKMLKNPGMKDMIRAQQKGQMDMTYGPLFKYLQISEQGLEKFKNLLLDRQMALVDSSMNLMSGEATKEEKKAAGEAIKELTAAYDAQVKELLGDENYGVFKSYEETQAERMQVSLFKGALAAADQLSDEQEDGLIRAMHEARSNFKFAMPDMDGKQQTPDPSQFTQEGIAKMQEESARLQEAYVAEAAKILTPVQLEQFKANLKQQQAMQEMGLRMAAKMFGQGKPDATVEKK
jgi:CRISPR/Cas system-associated endoribonuclease Cas2